MHAPRPCSPAPAVAGVPLASDHHEQRARRRGIPQLLQRGIQRGQRRRLARRPVGRPCCRRLPRLAVPASLLLLLLCCVAAGRLAVALLLLWRAAAACICRMLLLLLLQLRLSCACWRRSAALAVGSRGLCLS